MSAAGHFHLEYGHVKYAPVAELVGRCHLHLQCIRHYRDEGILLFMRNWNQDHRSADTLRLPPGRGDIGDGFLVVLVTVRSDAAHQPERNRGGERQDAYQNKAERCRIRIKHFQRANWAVSGSRIS